MRDDERQEWLEADGLGGFASGTVAGTRTRRYHGWLLVAKKPPAERVMLVQGADLEVVGEGWSAEISSNRYRTTLHPRGVDLRESFTAFPWPTWRFRLPDGSTLAQELFVPRGTAACVTRWWREGEGEAVLRVRPFLSGRFFHSVMREHPRDEGVRFDARQGTVTWPMGEEPAVRARFLGRYVHEPNWYRGFALPMEKARGLDGEEDLWCPGILELDLRAPTAIVWSAGADMDPEAARARELDRRTSIGEAGVAAEAYVVKRGDGASVIAGYPWFGDWGRDTFIALRGLSLATGGRELVGEVLRAWSGVVSEGMVPNRFPDAGDAPEYNSVDASLWFAVVAGEYLAQDPTAEDEERIGTAMRAVIDGFRKGTRYGIRVDDDGLVAAGVPGVQLTWMDAKVGDWVVTPRIGKPVEVQALWLNALRFAAMRWPELEPLMRKALASFAERFPCPENGGLHDVVDVGHQRGTVDRAVRPNQIFCVGGLPHAVLGGDAARRVVDLVESQLWTPLGLRSLAPQEPGFVGRYEGGVRERDGSYHQGIAWGWLLGPFVEAWLRVRGASPAAKAEARTRFLAPLEAHLDDAGLGHVSEIADAIEPFTPRGTPFQAWSLGELLRIRSMLAE